MNVSICSTQPVLVPPFVGQSPSGIVAMTGIFNAFKFEQTNTVFFQCNASLCYDGDLRCFGNHCTTNGRRKREITDETFRVLGVSLTVNDNMTSTVQEHIINSEVTSTASSGGDQYKKIVGTPRKTSSSGSPSPLVDCFLLIAAITYCVVFSNQ
ncbi:hypothetical protein Btru_034828 [Bulinus truncatus]|nr:hypothetical protein Btru_034828 [Bulinus truncatus]